MKRRQLSTSSSDRDFRKMTDTADAAKLCDAVENVSSKPWQHMPGAARCISKEEQCSQVDCQQHWLKDNLLFVLQPYKVHSAMTGRLNEHPWQSQQQLSVMSFTRFAAELYWCIHLWFHPLVCTGFLNLILEIIIIIIIIFMSQLLIEVLWAIRSVHCRVKSIKVRMFFTFMTGFLFITLKLFVPVGSYKTF